MSEIKSLAAPKASFDRRAVVKGAAWSVPVIAAAIAAPAAAASHHTYSAALILGTNRPIVSGTPQMSGTGPQGFAVSTTGDTFTGAVSVVINVQPDAATAATGVGLAVTASALTRTAQSEPYNFAYSRTGTANVASDVVLKYTVTVSVTVIESAAKSTVLPAMVFDATLYPATTLSLVAGPPVIGGTPTTSGTGPKGLTVTTSGTALTGTVTVGFTVRRDAAAIAADVSLDVTATAVTRIGKSASYDFAYQRTGGKALKPGDVLTYTVTMTVTGAGVGPAGISQDFTATLYK